MSSVSFLSMLLLAFRFMLWESWTTATAEASIRSVSGSWWDRSGEDAELPERSGRTVGFFSKDHCWSWVDTARSTIFAAAELHLLGAEETAECGGGAVIMCAHGFRLKPKAH